PARALFGALLLNELVILLAVGGLMLYVGVSAGEFASLVGVAWGFELLHDLLAIPLIRRMTRPIVGWLQADQKAESASQTWEAAVSLPWEFVRRDTSPRRRLGLLVWVFIGGWCAYFAWELRLPAYAGVLLFVGTAVYFAYAYAVRFFVIERVMRPVVEDLASWLPDQRAPSVARFSLRARLLAALPAINV